VTLLLALTLCLGCRSADVDSATGDTPTVVVDTALGDRPTGPAGGAEEDQGGGGNGGSDTGAGDGPTPCEDEEDCVDGCPSDAMGCTCHEDPSDGLKACKSTCETDDDCPQGGRHPLTCDLDLGICEGAGGGGGGPR